MSYRIYIPTRGRTDNQLTVERLPKYLHKYVTLVCPREEVKALRANYPTVNVMSQPAEITTLNKKREWIMTELSRPYRFVFMMDDDLYFYVFNGEKHVVASTCKEATKKFWGKTMVALTKQYQCVGIGTKAFAPKGGVKENTHLGFVFGMDRKTIKKVEWSRLRLYSDIDYTLQLLKKGVRIAVTYDMAVAQRAAAGKGGLTGERSAERSEKALRKLMKFHPGIVQRKEASASHPEANTRISWRGAAKIGGLVK